MSEPANELAQPAKRALLDRLLREDGGPERRALASFGQRRLWFLTQLAPDSPVYNLWNAVQLRGELDEDALEAAIQEVVRRHESLRTTFVVHDGEPVQAIHHSLPIHLECIDRRGSSGDFDISTALAAEAWRPFDLESGPLFRATVFRLADDSQMLLVSMHHIVADGWSLRVLFRELAVFYAGFCRGRATSLRELPIQYADYAQWQRETFGEADPDGRLAHWAERLRDISPLELPTDRRLPAAATFAGATVSFRVPKELAESLSALAESTGATLFMVLLAAFDVLMYRYTGQTDVAVGSPIANRTQPELQGLIGFFANTVIMRTDLSGEPTFRELLARVRETTLEAYAHQDVPYELIVQSLNPIRRSSRNPLFNVMFQVLQFPRGSSESPSMFGLPVRAVAVEDRTAKFELTCTMSATAAGLTGAIQYETDLFDRPTIERMAGHYLTLLRSVVDSRDQRVDTLPILPPDERRRLVVDWNATHTDYPSSSTIHALFQDWVLRSPDAVALACDETALTYDQVNRRANRLAHQLIRKGVRPGAKVALCYERSVELVVATLAILKAGAAYVPLDPSYPHERIRFMLSDSDSRWVLTDSRFAESFHRHSVEVLCPEVTPPDSVADSDLDPVVRLSAVDPAYVMYTSGSTGEPKGVVVVHRGVVRLVVDADRLAFSSQDVFLLLAPVIFDASTLEMWGALLNGARLAIFTEPLPVLAELGAAISSHGVSTLFLTTPLFDHVVATDVGMLAGVRHLLTGGDMMSPAHAQTVLRDLPGCRLTNAYGPTENTTLATMYTVEADETGLSIPIGTPVANTQVYVLDDHQNLCPAGVSGELYIGGDGLAQGYLNRPQLTRSRFVPNPFSSNPTRRLYRTGDRVRRRADGQLEFLGRVDDQVKILGFRVEPGEVEACLAGHPQVRDVLVLAMTSKTGDRQLVAYLTSREDSLTIEAVRRFLQRQLPTYMVPGYIVLLPKLPLLANGKVDRTSLPSPEERPARRQDRPAQQLSAFEDVIAQVWSDVLRVSPIAGDDSFFELGGHSLLATQLVSRIRSTLRAEIPLRLLFDHPTLSGYAQALQDDATHGAHVQRVARAIDEIGTLSDEQVDVMLAERGRARATRSP